MSVRWVRNKTTGFVVDVPEGHWALTHANFTPATDPYAVTSSDPVQELPDTAYVTLPDDFPARDALARHGYETIASLDGLTVANLTRLKGIGPARANAIITARDQLLP